MSGEREGNTNRRISRSVDRRFGAFVLGGRAEPTEPTEPSKLSYLDHVQALRAAGLDIPPELMASAARLDAQLGAPGDRALGKLVVSLLAMSSGETPPAIPDDTPGDELPAPPTQLNFAIHLGMRVREETTVAT